MKPQLVQLCMDETTGNEAIYINGELVAAEDTLYAAELPGLLNSKPSILEHHDVNWGGRDWPDKFADLPLGTPQ